MISHVCICTCPAPGALPPRQHRKLRCQYGKCTTIQGMWDSGWHGASCVHQPGKPHPQLQAVIISMDFSSRKGDRENI